MKQELNYFFIFFTLPLPALHLLSAFSFCEELSTTSINKSFFFQVKFLWGVPYLRSLVRGMLGRYLLGTKKGNRMKVSCTLQTVDFHLVPVLRMLSYSCPLLCLMLFRSQTFSPFPFRMNHSSLACFGGGKGSDIVIWKKVQPILLFLPLTLNSTFERKHLLAPTSELSPILHVNQPAFH